VALSVRWPCAASWRRGGIRNPRVRLVIGKGLRGTRTELTRDLPAYLTGVAAMGPACRSVEEFKRELGIGSDSAKRKLPGGALPPAVRFSALADGVSLVCDVAEPRLREA
jgi:hypothetical protein